MNIQYLFRNPTIGYSIQHVFDLTIGELKKDGYKLEIKSISMPSPNSMPWDILKNSIYTFRKKNKKGINHITGHIHDVILGLIGCKTVLTVHDLVFIDNVKNPIKRFYKWLFWLYIPVKMANKVTCISEQTKSSILKHIKTDKLVVIPNPLDPKVEYQPKIFNKEKPVILHIGTGWNKNLKRTIQALQGINCHLRIIGKIEPETTILLSQYQIDCSNGYDLSDEEIRAEYINCDIVNFPSEYEGFGMPVIEGQKTGRVVITSAIEPLIEVSGGACEFVDPYSVESIKNAYNTVIANSEKRENLIANGLKNVERFSVENIASQYLDVYKKVLNKS